MNYAHALVCLFCNLAWVPAKESAPPAVVRSEIRADLLGNGKPVTIQLDTRRAAPVTLTDGGRTIALTIRRHWKPWRVATADLDGDGRREMVVALYKPTRFIPKPHNCIFVYRYDGHEIYPLWLGSTMGRPFTAFAIGRLHSRRDILVTLDLTLDGRQMVTAHAWIGFGFQKHWSWGPWRKAKLIGIANGRIVAEADGERISRGREEEE